MLREHAALAEVLADIKQHAELASRRNRKTQSSGHRFRLTDATYSWIGAYLEAFYSEALRHLRLEIAERRGLVLTPMTAEPHHWNVTAYQKKMVTYCDRIVAPVDLADIGAFWSLVETPGMYELIRRGLVYPLPRRFAISPDFTFEVEELGSLEFAGSEEEFRAALGEGVGHGLVVPLPQVSNIDLDRLLDLREEYVDDWQRYQASVRKLLEDSPAVTSEGKLRDMVFEIDHHVRQLAARMAALRLVRKRDALSLGASTAGFVLPLVTGNPEVIALIASVMAPFTLDKAVRFFSQRREIEHQLRAESDFFYAWKVSDLDRAAGQRTRI